MYITDIVYLLDVLVVIVFMSYFNCWDHLLLRTRIGVSVLRTGRGRGGGWNFLTEKIIPLRNVPGVLKRQKNKVFFPTNFFLKMFLGF